MTATIAGAAFRYLPIVILLALWQAASSFGWVSTAVLPPLTAVFEAGVRLLESDDFWSNAGASLYRGGTGLLLAIVIGAVIGIAIAWWRPVRSVLIPIVEIFYPLPSALIPVTAVWLGFGDASKICDLPRLHVAGHHRCVQRRQRTDFFVWSALQPRRRPDAHVVDVVPSALPGCFGGVRTALALSGVVGCVKAVVARSGLGYLIGFLGTAATMTACLRSYCSWHCSSCADRAYRVATQGCCDGANRRVCLRAVRTN
jgi:ABC-type proline/glycine betaine transport system permease subunit